MLLGGDRFFKRDDLLRASSRLAIYEKWEALTLIIPGIFSPRIYIVPINMLLIVASSFEVPSSAMLRILLPPSLLFRMIRGFFAYF